jgi:hypothetical protein
MSQANFKIVPEKDDAFDQACDMERPLEAIRNFALALDRIAQTLEDGNAAAIVQELGLTIQARVQELDKTHEYFFQLHHPNRDRFERDGWPTEQATEAVDD